MEEAGSSATLLWHALEAVSETGFVQSPEGSHLTRLACAAATSYLRILSMIIVERGEGTSQSSASSVSESYSVLE